MNKIVFVTGATAGIGEACAYKFAQNSYNVIIAGRRGERLEKMATELRSAYGVEILSVKLDVRDKEEVKRVISELPDA